MIDFYYWPTPNGHKTAIALEEFELEYRVRSINILKGEQHVPDFLAISPNNRVPAIVDTDGPGGTPHAVFESGAIFLYLVQKTGKFWPSDPVQQSVVTQWLFFQNASIGPMFGQCGYFNGYAKERVEHGIERYCGETKRLYGVIDKRLGEVEFLAGSEYSVADMSTYPWMTPKQQNLHGIDVTEFPNVERWLETVGSRPAVQRGVTVMAEDMKVGNPTEESFEAMFNQR
ncbi:glutathione S-transferase [Parasphingorhabdus marina DSM 22363]|uniref:Glutathione S-transferase n=1 Tax=Parasphingorhabdus marina DSM 22363 TaxID=1123272 RepID=A0A1N6D081_9SPHN|nr:glutathione S-transferase N-terminal domain-containing protein [Parasphingorhabdus marina]SIN64116.1 glutathione S-transferase [Parasphingorhabdus marina DSM 22363]